MDQNPYLDFRLLLIRRLHQPISTNRSNIIYISLRKNLSSYRDHIIFNFLLHYTRPVFSLQILLDEVYYDISPFGVPFTLLSYSEYLFIIYQVIILKHLYCQKARGRFRRVFH